MIDRENLDFIHVCTPNNSHFEIAKYAKEKKGKDIITLDRKCNLLLEFVNENNRHYFRSKKS